MSQRVQSSPQAWITTGLKIKKHAHTHTMSTAADKHDSEHAAERFVGWRHTPPSPLTAMMTGVRVTWQAYKETDRRRNNTGNMHAHRRPMSSLTRARQYVGITQQLDVTTGCTATLNYRLWEFIIQNDATTSSECQNRSRLHRDSTVAWSQLASMFCFLFILGQRPHQKTYKALSIHILGLGHGSSTAMAYVDFSPVNSFLCKQHSREATVLQRQRRRYLWSTETHAPQTSRQWQKGYRKLGEKSQNERFNRRVKVDNEREVMVPSSDISVN